MKTLTLLFLIFCASLSLSAQSLVRLQPDCVLSFTISANGSSSNFDNRFSMCDNWSVDWETYGGSPAATITFQGARSNAAGTAPGTYGTFSGTTISGSNPSTSLASSYQATGFQPWVRLNVSGLTGSVRGQIIGCRLPCSLTSGGGGGGGSVTVTNFPDPQNTNPNVAYGLPACSSNPSRQAISITGTGALQIIAASGSLSIKLCKVQLAANAATTVQFSQGTGTNCGTGTANIFGGSGLPNITNVALDYDGGMILSAGQAFCISSSVASAISGVVTYVQN